MRTETNIQELAKTIKEELIQKGYTYTYFEQNNKELFNAFKRLSQIASGSSSDRLSDKKLESLADLASTEGVEVKKTVIYTLIQKRQSFPKKTVQKLAR